MQLIELLQLLFERGVAFLFRPSSLEKYAILATILSITLLLEIVTRQNWKERYGSANFRVDVLYYVFYYGGFYHLLIFLPLYAVMVSLVARYAPWLKMNLLTGMAPVWQIVIAILVSDIVGYWVHRATHASPLLWRFHAIHHSQERLTVMTNYRFHIVDETFRRIGFFIPFQILGSDFRIWIAVDFVMAWILLLQHSEWNWTYGRVGRIFVSPRFHQIHHSADPAHQNRNYSMLFSVWDDLFGTSERAARAERYGLGSDRMPESFFGQIVWPFARLVRDWRPAKPLADPGVAPVVE